MRYLWTVMTGCLLLAVIVGVTPHIGWTAAVVFVGYFILTVALSVKQFREDSAR